MTYLHPRDPRWQGPARWYMYFDLVKNVVLFAFIILVIVETALFRHWYMDHHSTVEFDSDETAVDFFFRIGLALLPDIFSTILTHTLLRNQHFHPVFALTQALVIFCLYPAIFTVNLIVVYSNESSYVYIDPWKRLCWAEMGVQVLLIMLWTALVVCACVSVHQWRGVRAKEVLRGLVREEMELKSGEGRKDGASREEDGLTLVDGSIRSSGVFV